MTSTSFLVVEVQLRIRGRYQLCSCSEQQLCLLLIQETQDSIVINVMPPGNNGCAPEMNGLGTRLY
jgi:hypothetical protein